MRALIVEDDRVSVNILFFFVKDFFDCDTANDGEEGWKKFSDAHQSSNPYDYIFLDIMMPEKDGQALLNDIRDYEKDHNIKKCKIIMTTALSDFDTVVKSFEKKCDDYITKPIDKEKVLTVLERTGISLSKKR
ncbi:MAG: response regulator [Thermotogota bacterium]|nr:response regulator [Thermotogota bacterium]